MPLPQSGSKISLGDIRTEMSLTASSFSLTAAQNNIYKNVNLTGAPDINDTYPVTIGEFGGYNDTSASSTCGMLYDGLVLGYWSVLGPNSPFTARRFHNKWWMVQQQRGVGYSSYADAYSSSVDAFLPRGAEMIINGALTLYSASYGQLSSCFAFVSSAYGGLAAPDNTVFPVPEAYYYYQDIPGDYYTYTSQYNLPSTGSVTTLAADIAEVKYLGGVTGSYSYSVDLGTTYGEVTLTYDSGELPDRFIVQYSGSTVIDTGFRGNTIHNRALKRRGKPNGISGSAAGTATFTKLSTQTGSIVIVQSPLGNTNFGFTLSSPVRPAQQTVTFYARVSGSVSPTNTNPKIYWNTNNDVYATTTNGYLTGSVVSSSTYVNMGVVSVTSGSTISYFATDNAGTNISACYTQNCTGSFVCGAANSTISSNTNVYVTIPINGSGAYVSCTEVFGPGIYYTLTGI
jgi:hypothetical protein